MLLIAAVAACLGRQVNLANTQRNAVAAIRRSGGSVVFDYEFDARGNRRSGRCWAPTWLQDAFGPDYFRTVYAFDMPSKTKGADLDFTRSLTDLRIFTLWDSDVRDEHLTHIRSMPHLIRIDLGKTHAGDGTIENMAHLSRLESLWLRDTDVTDAGLVHLRGKTTLKQLILTDAPITDGALVTIASLTGLKDLGLQGTRVSDAGLVSLHRLTGLRGIRLKGTNVTAAGVAELQKALPNLKIDGP
jgi:hypothetical protein